MQSKWNGYKLMSPNVQEAIPQFDSRFPNNVHGMVPDNPREFSQVFHDLGMDKLRPGIVTRGEESSVDIPADIHRPTARVMVHSHPYTGQHYSDIPSIDDQMVARRYPKLEHIVQTPAPEPGKPNVYQIFSGSLPPRYYTLVPNPGNLPVPPHSPDGHARFHPMPGEGSGSGPDGE